MKLSRQLGVIVAAIAAVAAALAGVVTVAAPASATTSASWSWSWPTVLRTPQPMTTTQGFAVVGPAVSCASPDFCVAVSPHYAWTWDGSAWSGPTGVDQSGDLTSVSCPVAGWCAAVDSSGYAYVDQFGSWAAGVWDVALVLDGGTALYGPQVSCAGPGACMAVDGDSNTYVLNGQYWSEEQVPDSTAQLVAISCPSPQPVASWCAAFDLTTGDVFVHDPSWRLAATLPAAAMVGPLPLLSCASTTFCMLGAGSGAYEWDGTSWSSTPVPSSSASSTWQWQALSCPSASWCMGSAGGRTKVWDGTSWSSSSSWGPPLPDNLSCPVAGWCMATTACPAYGPACELGGLVQAGTPYYGVAFVGPGPAWQSQPAPSLAPSGQIWSPTSADFGAGTGPGADVVSCASPDFCGGLSDHHAYIWDGTSWSQQSLTALGFPAPSASGGQLTISCPVVGWCMATVALDNMPQDNVPTYKTVFSGGWSAAAQVDSSPIVTMSCTGPDFCAAADLAGNALTWDGTSWSAPTLLGDGSITTALSCASAQWCLWVGDYGLTYVWDGTSWSLGQQLPVRYTYGGSPDVACPSPDWCVLVNGWIADGGLEAEVDNEASVFVLADGHWSSVNVSGVGQYGPGGQGGPPQNVSCPVVGWCMLATDYHTYQFRPTAATMTWEQPPSPVYTDNVRLDFAGLGSVSCASTTWCMGVDGQDGWSIWPYSPPATTTTTTTLTATTTTTTLTATTTTVPPTTTTTTTVPPATTTVPPTTTTPAPVPAPAPPPPATTTTMAPPPPAPGPALAVHVAAPPVAPPGATIAASVTPAVVAQALSAPPSLSLSAQGGTITHSQGADWHCAQPTQCGWTGPLPIQPGQHLPPVHSTVKATSRTTVVIHATLRAADLRALGQSTTRIRIAGCSGAHFRGSVPGVLGREHRQLRDPVVDQTPPESGCGYRLVAQDGGVFSFAAAKGSHFHGSVPGVLGAKKLHKPVFVGVLPDGPGYWLVARDGGVFAFGKARFYGSLQGELSRSASVVAAARTPDGKGYWLATDRGGVFAFGDAKFYGSAASPLRKLSSPIVDIAAAPGGHGYWLVARDGTVYTYGDAHNYGSAHVSGVIGMVLGPGGHGYWLFTRTGAVFSFGDARFHGSVPGVLGPEHRKLNKPVIAMWSTPDGRGYWLVAADGGVFAFGDARFSGSIPGILASEHKRLDAPVVSGSPAPGGGYWLVATDGGVFAFRGAGLP